MQISYLYILYSNSIDRYYIGTSHDPDKRLQYHNTSNKGWTCRGRPWTLVFSREFNSKFEAQKWELTLKRIGKRSVIEKILNTNFDWQ